MNTVLLFLLFSLSFLNSFGQTPERISLITTTPGGGPLSGAEFDFFPAGVGSITCWQACPSFYSSANGRLNGSFKFELSQILEINSTNQPCCLTTCGSACDFHAIQYFYDVFNYTTSQGGTQVQYSAYLSSSPLGRQCTAADDSPICALVELNYTSYNSAGVAVIDNASFQVPANSVFGSIKVSNWNFGTGSLGLSFVLQLYVINTNPLKYVVNPGNAVDPPAFSGVSSVTSVDVMDREGSIGFVNYATYTGQSTAVNVTTTGPFQYPSLGVGRFFTIFVPRTAGDNAQVYFNLYLPTLTGNPSDIVSSVNNLVPIGFLFIIGILVILLL